MGSVNSLADGKYLFPLYFKRERAGQLVIPREFSREDFELLKLQINYSLETIEGALLPSPSKVESPA